MEPMIFQLVNGMLQCLDSYAKNTQDIDQGLRKNTEQGKQKSPKMILTDQESYGKTNHKTAHPNKKKNKWDSKAKKAGQPDEKGALKILP